MEAVPSLAEQLQNLQLENLKLRESLRQAERVQHRYGEAVRETKRMESSLSRANAILNVINRCGQELLEAGGEIEWLGKVCRIITESSNYQIAWIGHNGLAPDELRLVAHAGFGDKGAEEIALRWAHDRTKICPVTEAVHSGQPSIIADIRKHPACSSCVVISEQHGPLASIFLPLHFGAHQIGVLSLYARGTEPFDRDETALLTRLADELSLGVSFLRTRAGHRQAEAELRHEHDSVVLSEHRFRTLIDTLPQNIFLKSTDSTYLTCNESYARLLGLKSPRDIVGRRDEEFFPAGVAQKYQADDKQVAETGVPIHEEGKFSPEPGRETSIEIVKTPLRDESGRVAGVLGIFWDITRRKADEIALQHANRALATLGAVNRELVHAGSEDELLRAVCRDIAGQSGYRLAWVGYRQDDPDKSIKVMAHAGFEEGYLETLRLTWEDSERGQGPSGRAMRSGATEVAQNILTDPHYHLWRDAARKRGYASSISLPLKNEAGEVFGLLNVYAEEAQAFTPREIGLLEQMANDLAFGVRALQTRLERDLALELVQQHLEQLQGNLEDTVRAIATMVEMRDPYTAGHQTRVADLAVAIATQMGLPVEQAHAIHLAGIVHDLGKIHIPAEILSKPGRLSDIEYDFIKTHPQAGFDILKDIDFPWPIAQMVLQHHERLDGSGYPQGLKGEAILLEARILSVADVVEAMSSHRPYRTGLGVEAALAEIGGKRGVHYDTAVVDACLVLFGEKNYALPK